MSAQVGTIAPRRTVELPIWAAGVVALIVVGLLATIVIQRQTAETATATTGTVVHGTFPGALETSGFARPAQAVTFPGALETSGFARPAPAVTFPGALETSGFAGARAGARSAPQSIMIGDYPCHQCR